MDYRVDWSPEALEDIESIAEYISRDSEFYAKAVVTAIIHLSREIDEFPFMGRIVPEIGDVKWTSWPATALSLQKEASLLFGVLPLCLYSLSSMNPPV